MAHELTIAADTGRAEMAYAGQVPWHGLGQSLTPDAPLETWQREAGMGWRIKRAPVHYTDHTGCFRKMHERDVLLRSDTGAALGVVSKAYNEVQPGEVLEFFRDLVDGQGFALETAGTLFGGKRFWALARVAADAALLDPADKVGGFLLLSTSADGSMATEARFTTVRVVCNNTLGFARRAGDADLKVPHREAWCADRAKRKLGIGRDEAEARFAEAMESFRRLAERPLPGHLADNLTMALFDVRPTQLTADGAKKFFSLKGPRAIRDLASGAGLIGDELEGGRWTAWSWLNAVTQHADHAAASRSPSGRLDSAWFGRNAERKRRALDLALATL